MYEKCISIFLRVNLDFFKRKPLGQQSSRVLEIIFLNRRIHIDCATLWKMKGEGVKGLKSLNERFHKLLTRSFASA